MTVINENGKQYILDDDTGLVTEAHIDAEEMDAIADEFRVGQRVEVAGRLGQLISIVASVYGPAFGVRFDDGDIDEFVESQLKRSSAEVKSYDSPIEEIFARYAAYEELPSYTAQEIEDKEAEARWLHLQASTLRTYSAQGGFRDPKLDEIVLVTSSDLSDFKSYREDAEHEDNQRYLSSFNKFEVANEIMGSEPNFGKAASSDASWLDSAYEGMEIVETTDADLAARATEVVASLSREQLENDEFMTLVASFQNEYLQNDEGREKVFAQLLKAARAEALREAPQTPKSAATEEDFSSIPDSALYT